MSTKADPYTMQMHRRIDIILFAVAFAIVAILLSSSAKAAPLYWDTDNSPFLQAGNGDWSTSIAPASQRWSNIPTGSTPASWTQNSDAIFQTNGISAVNVSGVGINAINVNSIAFNGTGYTISGDPLTLTGFGGLITTNASAIINTPLHGTVGLTKLGTATLTLGSTSNAFSGATQVDAGTLLVVGNTPTGSAVTVSNAQTVLGGTGTVGGTVSVGPLATINAGLSGPAGTALAVGNLTTGALSLSGALHTDAAGTAAANWDKITAPGTFTINSTATFDVSIPSGLIFAANTTYVLVDATTLSGTFTGFDEGSLYTTNGYTFTVHYDIDGGNFDLISVPEPSTWALLGWSLALVGFTQRRRFQKLARLRAS
ncbi:MAG: autotransporter-associated beta strand repeat-containing protein [Verrucomicrobiota bacterium]|nr:autotransporter-associated beta strand repeat-containing protein [Verrucomicrobiota bacterium]